MTMIFSDKGGNNLTPVADRASAHPVLPDAGERCTASSNGSALRSWRLALSLLSVIFLCSLPACNRQPTSAQPTERPAVPVIIMTAEEKPMDVEVHGVGTVEPIQTVSVKAQVTGTLTKVAFKEGDDVQENQLLFEIDPRSFEAELRRLQAVLEKDRAQLKNAELQAKRYEELVQKDFVTKSQYDDIRTQAEVLRATVKSDQESVANAQLQLDHASIRSPLSGRTGEYTFHLGDQIKANDTMPLVVINQIKPILISFSVPSDRLSDIQRFNAAGSLPVDCLVAKSPERRVRGSLTFVDNSVNATTGAITLKAQFDNQDGALWPGQFFEVALVLTSNPRDLVVSSSAVQTSQDGSSFVYVVKSDSTVDKRTVTVDRIMSGTAVIASGLTAGEQVVTDGQLRLVPGAKIQVKTDIAGGGQKK